MWPKFYHARESAKLENLLREVRACRAGELKLPYAASAPALR
ncbi:MAG: hypothetical protein ACREV9_14910 [Burkholderiales bacterium]